MIEAIFIVEEEQLTKWLSFEWGDCEGQACWTIDHRYTKRIRAYKLVLRKYSTYLDNSNMSLGFILLLCSFTRIIVVGFPHGPWNMTSLVLATLAVPLYAVVLKYIF